MIRQLFPAIACILFSQGVGAGIAEDLPSAVARKIDFAQDVQPLLKDRCWSCHAGEKQESGLRLDRRDLMMSGGDLGTILEPGKSESSRLIHYVHGTDPDHVMPPEGDRLTNEQVGILRAWIDQGCEWPESANISTEKNSHWAYQPIKAHSLPAVQNPNWPLNEIDHFVLAELERRNIKPSPEADRHTLIRRLSLDLTGLLPTTEEVDSFVNDTSPGAYGKLVDRLLASPHYGERWGRHWLDLARYADSDGYEKDNPRPDAYRWRDWVIDAINADMPFDQFTIEQLAGDLLPDATPMQRLATAFHRQTLTNTEGGTDQEQFRVEACFDRTETTGTVWLGLTVGCARCHSHKYDAITQREYYQLFSVFNNGDESTTTVPKSEIDVTAYAGLRSAYDEKLSTLTTQLAKAQLVHAADFTKWQHDALTTTNAVASDPIELHVLKKPSYSSEAGVLFEQQQGGVVLVSGENPERAVYTITGLSTLRSVRGIRLDVFPDKSLPANGPGRVAHGNFVLSELTLEVASKPDFSDAQRIEFANAMADFEQADRPWVAKNVLDADDKSGWAIAPEYGKKHWLTASLKQTLDLAETGYVRVRLSHQYGQQHTIGRFKISLQTGTEADAALPENIVRALNQPDDQRSEEQKQLLQDHFARQTSPLKELVAKVDELKKEEPPKPELAVRVVVQRTQNPRKTHVLRRGEFLNPLTELEVQPAGLATLPELSVRENTGMGDRLDLACWLVAPENPLTPRVTANHVWRILFGHGIVRTANDFGVRGEKPTHPELLDWLAADLMSGAGTERAWSRKALIRRIVKSATYRQASRHRTEMRDVDPQNLLLARQNRIRVEGEIVRDISLDVSGLLSHKVGGPSVYPPLPPGIAELSYAGNFKWADSQGEDRYRRGMYTFFKRTSPHPNLITFDCPDANICCIERQSSNTPLQALTSLNNETFAETARAFARRLLSADARDDAARMSYAMRLCVARNITTEEQVELQSLLNDSKAWYLAHPDQAAQLIGTETISGVPSETAAAWIAVARVLLNLDEFITRE